MFVADPWDWAHLWLHPETGELSCGVGRYKAGKCHDHLQAHKQILPVTSHWSYLIFSGCRSILFVWHCDKCVLNSRFNLLTGLERNHPWIRKKYVQFIPVKQIFAFPGVRKCFSKSLQNSCVTHEWIIQGREKLKLGFALHAFVS